MSRVACWLGKRQGERGPLLTASFLPCSRNQKRSILRACLASALSRIGSAPPLPLALSLPLSAPQGPWKAKSLVCAGLSRPQFSLASLGAPRGSGFCGYVGDSRPHCDWAPWRSSEWPVLLLASLASGDVLMYGVRVVLLQVDLPQQGD